MDRPKLYQYLIYFTSLVIYVWITYFTPRTDFVQFAILYTLLFLGYTYIIYRGANIRLGIAFAIIFRLSLLYLIPNLSDDYFRFIWDGQLLASGENPFLHIPSYYTASGMNEQLFAHLNSKEYFTIYPPICQFIYWTSVSIFPNDITGSVVIMRCFLLFFEIGSIFIISQLATRFQLPPKSVLIYALNPLVIIEITGNLHFEGLMVFFLLLALYHLFHNKQNLSAISFGMAAGVKLIPFIFLPLLIRKLGIKKGILYSMIVGIVFLIPFYGFRHPDLFTRYFSSIQLYFQQFEFNASIYYIVRWLGYQLVGYNIIAQAGIVLAIITFLSIVFISMRGKRTNWQEVFPKMCWAITIYLGLASIVHPWYLVTLIALVPLTGFRYPIIWSALVMLSYAPYMTFPYQENLWLVAIEYLIVGMILISELSYRGDILKYLNLSKTKNFLHL